MSEIKTMVNIFYTNILYELPKQFWEKYIKSLPEDMIIRSGHPEPVEGCGAGGSRTRVQTRNRNDFYMLI